jgi:hypothetical protein
MRMVLKDKKDTTKKDWLAYQKKWGDKYARDIKQHLLDKSRKGIGKAPLVQTSNVVRSGGRRIEIIAEGKAADVLANEKEINKQQKIGLDLPENLPLGQYLDKVRKKSE